MSAHNIWQDLDRLSFCENAILLQIKCLQQGQPFKSRINDAVHDRVNPIGVPPELIRSFLDDFALAAAGAGGKDNVSGTIAAFQEDEKAVTIYVARNEGLGEQRLERLRHLLERIMARVSREDILLDLLERCSGRVLKHVEGFCNELVQARCQQPAQYHVPAFDKGSESETAEDIDRLGQHCEGNHGSYMSICVGRLNDLRAMCSKIRHDQSDFENMAALSRLAYEVRRSALFRKFLEDNITRPKRTESFKYVVDSLVERIGKIARFYRASMTFFAFGNHLSQGRLRLTVKGVPAPKIRIQELKDRTPVQLRARGGRSFSRYSDEQLKRGIRRWNTYRMHSEIQLLVYYEEHPSLTLLSNYIGCDKLCCYLCHTFITRHGVFEVGGCHQCLYSLWGLPDVVLFESEQRAEIFKDSLKQLCANLDQKVATLKHKPAPRFKLTMHNESIANLSRISLRTTINGTSNMPTGFLILDHSLSVTPEVDTRTKATSAPQKSLEGVLEEPEPATLSSSDTEEANKNLLTSGNIQPSATNLPQQDEFYPGPVNGEKAPASEAVREGSSSVARPNSIEPELSIMVSRGSSDDAQEHIGEDVKRRQHSKDHTRPQHRDHRRREKKATSQSEVISTGITKVKPVRRHRNSYGTRAKRPPEINSRRHGHSRRISSSSDAATHSTFSLRFLWRLCRRLAHKVFFSTKRHGNTRSSDV